MTVFAGLTVKEKLTVLTMLLTLSVSSVSLVKNGFAAAVNGTLQELCRDDGSFARSLAITMGDFNTTVTE